MLATRPRLGRDRLATAENGSTAADTFAVPDCCTASGTRTSSDGMTDAWLHRSLYTPYGTQWYALLCDASRSARPTADSFARALPRD